ncbi:MAG: PAS domain S-box protein [Gammaproteobacteria bacterium]
MNPELRILMVEDSVEDAELIEEELREGGVKFVLRRVQTRDAFFRALEDFQPDIVLSDFMLPCFNGREVLRILRNHYPAIPAIVITGAMGDELAVELLQAGAKDYILKDRLARLSSAVRRVLAETREIRDRMAAEKALRNSEEMFRSMTASAQDAIVLMDYEGKVSFWNAAAENIFGYSEQEALGQELHNLLAPAELHSRYRLGFRTFRESGSGPLMGKTLELNALRKNGTPFPVELSLSAVRLNDRWNAIGIVRDITSRKQAERDLYAREQEFRALAENSPDEIIRYDRACHRIYVNPAVEKALGFRAPDLLGKTPLQSSPLTPAIQDYQQQLHNVIASGNAATVELIMEAPKSGKQICSSVRLVPEFDPEGRVVSVLAIGRDISELKETERQLRTLAENSPDVIARFDREGRIVYLNPAIEQNFHVPVEKLLGHSLDAIRIDCPHADAVKDNRKLLSAALRHVIDNSLCSTLEITLPLATGAYVYEVRLVPERDDNNRVASVLGLGRDITERKQAEEKLRQAQRVFDHTTEGIMVTDANGYIVAVNRAFTVITGYTDNEALGQNPRMLKSGLQDERFYEKMWAALRSQGVWAGEICNRRKNGDVFPEWLTISAVENEQGKATHYVAVFSDITTVKQSQEALYFLAHYDPLTQLPNRLLCKDRLTQALLHAQHNDWRLAVLFIDLDRFKNVNDSLGHGVGDELLRNVAKQMAAPLNNGDTLARVGGDEFAIILEQNASPRSAAMVANKLIDLFVQPLRSGGHDLYITASIGISLSPADGEDADTLLRHADLAMHQAKILGRNTFQFYTQELTERVNERLQLENALRRALDKEELCLFYQPQVNMHSGALLGAEALMRWRHPEWGWVSPSRFIPIAEETGLIGRIGEWALRTACRQAQNWRQDGLEVPRIAVNLSIYQIERRNLLDIVAEILEETGLEPSRLELEITESMLMSHAEIVLSTLNGLRDLGVLLAVDDFGIGYSNLSYLKQLPLDRLKIDYSFVRDICQDPNDEAITRAIIGLGRSLGLEILAEGIERPEQHAWLLREGCRFGQGFLFGKPVPSEELFAIWSNSPSCSSPTS